MYLGVDGGQSSTTALIGDDDGRVVGIGRAGPCNHVKGPGGREKFVAALSESVAAASQEADLDSATLAFAAACLGFSGGPADKEVFVAIRSVAVRALSCAAARNVWDE